jgi:hypothetical protein
MFQETHERLMSEARAISNEARAALWRALVTARQIEKLVGHHVRRTEITPATLMSGRIQLEE